MGQGLLILGVLLMVQRKLALPWRDALKLIAVGLVGSGISLGAQFLGTDLSTDINGAVITSASPAFIVLFAWLILREPLTRLRLAAVALSSIGVLIVLDLSKLDLSSATLVGNLWLVFAALTWGAYSVLVRLVSQQFTSTTITFYNFIGGLLVGLLMSFGESGTRPIAPDAITLPIVLGVLYLGVVSSALALLWWNKAFALVEASVASLFFFAQPLVGVLLAVAINGRALTLPLVVGGALIILGVLLALRPPQKRAAARVVQP
jgi:drug/metabolite transporter (DMT)-like permease